jgi:hypothetical protein
VTKEDYIRREMDIWGEDYIFDLIDRGYEAVELAINGKLRWWWVLPRQAASGGSGENPLLTQADSCARIG